MQLQKGHEGQTLKPRVKNVSLGMTKVTVLKCYSRRNTVALSQSIMDERLYMPAAIAIWVKPLSTPTYIDVLHRMHTNHSTDPQRQTHIAVNICSHAQKKVH